MCTCTLHVYTYIITLACTQSICYHIQFLESQFELRSHTKHLGHCAILEQDDLSTAEQQHYSTVYGVNRQALLNTLEFSVLPLVLSYPMLCMIFWKVLCHWKSSSCLRYARFDL